MKLKMKMIIVLLTTILFIFVTACTQTPPPIPGPNPDPDPEPIPPTIVSQEDIMRSLESGIFRENVTCEEFIGLKNPELVGVDKDEFEKVYYPIPEDNEFAEIYNVTEYSISAENADNTTAINLLINQMKTVAGKKKVFFPEGVYRFSEKINFVGIDDVYLVGENAEWLVTTWSTIMNIENCNNFHINGFNFDFDPSPTVAGKVVSTNTSNKSVTIQLDDEFNLNSYLYNNGIINYGNYMEYVYDDLFDAYIPDSSGMLRYNSTGDGVNGISNGVYNTENNQLTLTFSTTQGSFKAPAKDKIVSVSFTMYEFSGFYVKKTNNFFMESNNIYTTPGMMISAYSCKNMYFNRTNMMLRPNSKRLQTATADGLHTNDCYGDLIVSNSIYENSHDDAMNLCTFYKTVTENSAGVLTVNAASQVTNFPTEIGDVVEFYDPNTMVSRGTRTVLNVATMGLSQVITLDSSIRAVQNGDLMGNLTRTPKMVVKNNIIRNKRNRGILAQVQNSEITGNAFYNIIHGALMIHTAKDIFNEGIIPKNLTIKNNKFFNNRGGNADVDVFRYGQGTMTAGVLINITVENNYFKNSNGRAVYFHTTGNSKISNNFVVDPCRGTNNSAFSIALATATTIKDNYVCLTAAKTGFAILTKNSDDNTTEANNILEIK